MIASNSPIRVFVDVNLRKVVGKGSFDSQNTTRISNLSLSLTSIIEGSIEAKKENRENWLSHRMKKMIYTHCIEGYIYMYTIYFWRDESKVSGYRVDTINGVYLYNKLRLYVLCICADSGFFVSCLFLSVTAISVCLHAVGRSDTKIYHPYILASA